MPFREKAKNFFRRRSSRSDTLSKTSSKDSSRDNWPSNVYKPGESMPQPKYRRPPEKAHKENLERFSFADAWRKKSFQSQHSPMGTRLPSRRNSFMSFRQKSLASRNASVASATDDKIAPTHKETFGAARAPKLSTEAEQEGDDDVANVGMRPLSRPRTAEAKPNDARDAAPPVHKLKTAHDHQPFTDEDIAVAITRSHLAVPTQ